MAKSNYGLISGFAAKLPDRTKFALDMLQRKAKQESEEKKANDKLMADLDKFVVNASKDIDPVYQDKASKAGRELIANYIKGSTGGNRAYRYSEPFLQAKNDYQAKMAAYRLSTKNARETYTASILHPQDYEMDPSLKEAYISGDGDRFEKEVTRITGTPTDVFQIGLGLSPKMNAKKIADAITSMVGEGASPSVPVKVATLPTGHQVFESGVVIDPKKVDDALAQLYATESYGKSYDDYSKAVKAYIPDRINVHQDARLPQKNTANNPAGTVHPKGNMLINSSYRPDGTVTISSTGAGIPAEQNKLKLYLYERGTGKPTGDYYVIKNPSFNFDPKNPAIVTPTGDITLVTLRRGSDGKVIPGAPPIEKDVAAPKDDLKMDLRKQQFKDVMNEYSKAVNFVLKTDNGYLEPNMDAIELKQLEGDAVDWSKSQNDDADKKKDAGKSAPTKTIYSKSKSGKDIYSNDGGVTWKYKK